MGNPVILIVDDEVKVLNAIERDLRQHYARDYRIIKASSGNEALETVQILKQRNEQVALFWSTNGCPGWKGPSFLQGQRRYIRIQKERC